MKHPIVSHDEWLAARTALLAEEKAHLRRGDELARKRRELPWEKVEKAYSFSGPRGAATLPELFGKHSQLIVYHFMFPPEDNAGCKHCSFWADNFDRIPIHLAHRDAAFVAISRAPVAKLEAYERRMGWTFPWWSSGKNDFNYDFGASFKPEQLDEPVFNYGSGEPGFADREGISIFLKDRRGDVFHTYSTYARGIEVVNGAYAFMDMLPKGRDEGDQPQSWVRYRDQYED
jgi:predicted dithiol-disulfide oxidoreductase (DUF899 family)